MDNQAGSAQGPQSGFQSKPLTKDILDEFQAKALAAGTAEAERVERQRELHKTEKETTARYADEELKKEDAAEAARHELDRHWREEQKQKREEIERDKARRAAETLALAEKRKQDDAYRAKQKAYLDSLHAHEHEKLLREKAEQEKEQAYQQGVKDADHTVRDAKLQAESEEQLAKNKLERGLIQRKDALDREFSEQKAALYSEGIRKKMQLESEQRRQLSLLSQLPDPVQKTRREKELGTEFERALSGFEREQARAATALEGEYRQKQRELEREIQKRKMDAENLMHQTKINFDQQFMAEKRRLEGERRKPIEQEKKKSDL